MNNKPAKAAAKEYATMLGKNRHPNRSKGKQITANLEKNAEMNGMKDVKGRQSKLVHR